MDPLAQAKKSKRTVTIILVMTALLAIVSVVTGYYYLQIKDLAPKDSKASNGCACYFVAATSTVTSCSNANTKMAYEFQTGTVQSNNTCSATCDLRAASTLVNSSQTTLACRVDDFAIAPGCVDVSVEDEKENRYANTVEQGKELTVKAKFKTPSNLATPDTDFFTGFSFIINGEKTPIQIAQATASGTGVDKSYEIVTKLKGYDSADALNIQAFGTSTAGAEMTSDACNRVLTVSKPSAPTCTTLQAEVVNDTNKKPKVDEITLSTSAVSKPSTLSVKFTLGDTKTNLTTKNIASSLTNGSLVLSKAYLYSASNFIDGKSFSILDGSTTKIPIAAEIYVDGKAINSENCSGTFDIPVIEDGGSTPTDGGNTPTDGGSTPTDGGNTPTDEGSTPTDGTTSDFSVTKSASIACVERTSPDNTLKYTITVKNNDTDSEKVVRVEDKLPLGFTYTTESTYIDGALVVDDDIVDLTEVGSTTQITFAKTSGWTLAAGDSMTIRFSVKVGTSALTGSNLNEVVVVPENTAKTASTLRTSKAVTVAQSCTAPETGIFDSTVSKVLLAMFIIFVGTYFYFSQSGLEISEKLVTSGLGQAVRKANLKKSNPKKYFEEKFIEELEKKK